MDESDSGYRFVCCLSCQGHGHFLVPGHGAQFEVFSKMDAFQQLVALTKKYRISRNQHARLVSQIQASGLSHTCRPDVVEYIQSRWNIETWAACYSYDEESRPKTMTIESDDLARAVHEYLLNSSGRSRSLH